MNTGTKGIEPMTVSHIAGRSKKGIKPVLAKCYTEHGSGLGKSRWVVERSLS
jgi:hypothetical protein